MAAFPDADVDRTGCREDGRRPRSATRETAVFLTQRRAGWPSGRAWPARGWLARRSDAGATARCPSIPSLRRQASPRAGRIDVSCRPARTAFLAASPEPADPNPRPAGCRFARRSSSHGARRLADGRTNIERLRPSAGAQPTQIRRRRATAPIRRGTWRSPTWLWSAVRYWRRRRQQDRSRRCRSFERCPEECRVQILGRRPAGCDFRSKVWSGRSGIRWPNRNSVKK